MKRKSLLAALAVLMLTSGAAQADECDIMATKIAKSVDFIVQPRKTQLIRITNSPGKEGAYHLNCGGTYGMNLHTFTPPDASPEWYNLYIRAGSILANAPQWLFAMAYNNASRSQRHQSIMTPLSYLKMLASFANYLGPAGGVP